MEKVCSCAHCLYEPECADNGWSIYIDYHPCYPNMKQGRQQYKQFLKEYLKERSKEIA